MSTDRTGIAAVATLLRALLEEKPLTVAGVAERHGLGRATAYEVARLLEAGGLVERSAAGRLAPGPGAALLGFAALGLAPMAPAAAVLVSSLRDDTDASAALVANPGGDEVMLVRRSAVWARVAEGRVGRVLEQRVETAPGAAALRLRLTLRFEARPDEAAAARACLVRVADRLAQTLREAADPGSAVPEASPGRPDRRAAPLP